MAWRTACRITGSPDRLTSRFRTAASPEPLSWRSRTTPPVTIRPKVEALTSRLSEAPRCFIQCPLPIFSAIRASTVSLSGMRSSASARHSRMTPSSEESAYSAMKASMPPCLWRLARAPRTSSAARPAMRARSSAVKMARSIRRSTKRVSAIRWWAAISSRGGPSGGAMRPSVKEAVSVGCISALRGCLRWERETHMVAQRCRALRVRRACFASTVRRSLRQRIEKEASARP